MSSAAATRSPHSSVSLGVALLATATGGAAGAVLRWALTSTGSADGFPWATFAVNVSGAALLAALVLLPVVRARPWLALLLGPGLLGGFTTMSAASTQTFVLLDRGEVGLGLAYAMGSVLAAVGAVLLVDRWATDDARTAFEQMEGDE